MKVKTIGLIILSLLIFFVVPNNLFAHGFGERYDLPIPIDYFIFGHRHLPITHSLKNKSKYINLGDWISHYTFGVFDGKNFNLRTFNP